MSMQLANRLTQAKFASFRAEYTLTVQFSRAQDIMESSIRLSLIDVYKYLHVHGYDVIS